MADKASSMLIGVRSGDGRIEFRMVPWQKDGKTTTIVELTLPTICGTIHISLDEWCHFAQAVATFEAMRKAIPEKEI